MNGCALWQGKGFPSPSLSSSLSPISHLPFPEHDKRFFLLFFVQADNKTRAGFAVTHSAKRMGFNKTVFAANLESTTDRESGRRRQQDS